MSAPRFAAGIALALAALGVAAAATHLLAEAAGRTVLALVAKPIPVLLLAGAVARARSSALRVAVFAGLVASAVGDVWIQRPAGFLGGLAAFLVAHLFYLSGFGRARPQLLAARAVPFVLFGLFMGWRLAPGLGSRGPLLALAVGVYIVAISAMLWRASALVGAPGIDPAVGRLALAGAIAFAASDSLIAVHRFLAPLAWADVPIMLLYWAGQAGIAAAAVRAGAAARRSGPGDAG